MCALTAPWHGEPAVFDEALLASFWVISHSPHHSAKTGRVSFLADSKWGEGKLGETQGWRPSFPQLGLICSRSLFWTFLRVYSEVYQLP